MKALGACFFWQSCSKLEQDPTRSFPSFPLCHPLAKQQELKSPKWVLNVSKRSLTQQVAPPTVWGGELGGVRGSYPHPSGSLGGGGVLPAFWRLRVVEMSGNAASVSSLQVFPFPRGPSLLGWDTHCHRGHVERRGRGSLHRPSSLDRFISLNTTDVQGPASDTESEEDRGSRGVERGARGPALVPALGLWPRRCRVTSPHLLIVPGE